MVPSFRLFIGIDQTGAMDRHGLEAKPLPCVVLHPHAARAKWVLQAYDVNNRALRLKSFNRASISEVTQRYYSQLGETALVVDCVMGVPEKAWPSRQGGSETLWNLFLQAARDSDDRNGYGLKPAATFFDEVRNRARLKTKPARQCEIPTNANSVFNTHPFQRNVQCGTYRIWRDLGLENQPPHQRWLRFWNFDPVPSLHSASVDQAWFFEAYPSLFWRKILKAKTRLLSELRTRVETIFGAQIEVSNATWSLLERDADYADSAVLALGAWFLQERGDLFMTAGRPKESWLQREGWILGQPYAPAP